MIPFEKLGFSLRTSNLERLAAFYSLFLELVHSGPGWNIFRWDQGQLTLWQQTGFRAEEGAALQMCFYVTDLEAACGRLEKLGPLTPIHHASHGREVFLTDPDGNILIFYEPKASPETPED